MQMISHAETRSENKPLWWAGYISIPALLFLAIWLGINTGPWVFERTPSSLIGWLHYARTTFPLAVIIIACIAFMERGSRDEKIIRGPAKLWLIYGLVSLLTCINSPRPLDATYWALNYLAVFVAMGLYLQGNNKLTRAMHLNYFNWVITTLFLTILVFVAREVLFVDYRYGWISGYGIIGRMDSVASMAMSRSSGMARFAAVPGIVSFVFLLTSSNSRRFLWVIPFCFSALLIWAMQSRGAIIGFAFAIAFVLVVIGPRSRLFGLTGMLMIGVFLFADIMPNRVERYVVKHFYRGQNYEEFITLTGRTRAWKKAWRQIKKAPLLGRGPQSDRYFIRDHVHNTYLYALLQSGFIGTGAFIGGLIWAWILFFRAVLRKTADNLEQHAVLIQTGGILAFFTVRSIPEVCGAMFGVDFLVMLPALAYLELLDRSIVKAK